MAEAYSFSLLVELGNHDVPKVQNKLIKYFQSKKSNGGDCLVEVSNGQRAVVRFRTEEARQKVLGKQVHEIKLDQGVLKLTVRLPPDGVTSSQETPPAVNSGKPNTAATGPKDLLQGGNTAPPEVQGEMVTDEEEQGSTSALLENIQESVDQELLEMLVENVLKDSPSASENFSLEILPDSCLAVVTFQNAKVTEHFMSSCPGNRKFMQKQLRVKPLEVTAKVKVENIPPKFSSEHVSLHFDRYEVVEDVVMTEEDPSAIITFQDPKAVDRILKQQHKEMKVFPFYESLGMALYGKDRPTLKLPAAFNENIDQAIWRYLSDKQGVAETIHKNMADHFCKVDFQQPTVQFSPLPSLLQQKDVEAKHINKWKTTAKAVFIQALSKFKTWELQIQANAWEAYEGAIHKEMSGEAVVVVPDKPRGIVKVVGLEEDVDRLKQTLNGIMDRIANSIEREKTGITEEFPLPPSTYHILLQDGLQDKITSEFPELKMTYNHQNQSVILFGLTQEVLGANRKFMEGGMAVKRRMVQLDNYVFEFLQKNYEGDEEQFTSSLFTSQGINAGLELERKGVQLLAVSEEVLNKAENQLDTLLISQYIDVEDSNVLKMSEWQDLVTDLEKAFNTPSKKFIIRTPGVYPSLQVVISGYKQTVDSVRKQVDDYLCQNTPVDETLEVKSNAIVKFIEEHNKNAWLDKVKDTVKVSFKDKAICLSGIRVYVKDCMDFFQNFISSTSFDMLRVSKPGGKKFFQEKEAMYVEDVFRQTGCVVHLVEKDDQKVQAMENTDQKGFGSHGKSLQRHNHPTFSTQNQHRLIQSRDGSDRVQTKEGLTIILMKGNIQDAMTQVVVNTVGLDLLLHSGAVSNAILKAAGPRLQDLINEQGPTGSAAEGAVIITDGCNLKSKLVFHTIAPKWDQGKGAAQKLLSGIVEECLGNAEQQRLVSMTFPAIGTGNLGFPKDLVASLMLDQVLKFSSKKKHKHLKEVVFILHPGDPDTIQAFSDEFNKRFTTKSATSGGSAAVSTQKIKGSSSSSAMYEIKMSGVVVQAVTGDITKEITDVIVNSSNSSFSLKSGVSKAILDAAGATVETECQQLGAKPHEGMIMTKPGNLQCKKIIHLVNQTDTKKIQQSVEGALKMCTQNNFTSISLPAIGTGQGNIQPSEVADAMLDAVVEVVGKKSQNSLKLVRMVIFQPAMLTDFHTSMLKKEGTDAQEKEGFLQNVLSFFTRRKVDNAQQNEVIEIESQDMDPACFHICGVSQAHVDHAKQVIKDLIVKEQDFNLINDKALFSLSELDLQNIYDMQTAMDVRISFHKSSQEEAKLTIEGLSKDVLKASNEIHEMLKKVRPEETFKDVPQHWDDMPANTPCLSFPIQAETQEHIDVLKLFEDTCKKSVLKIERIQNKSLWGGFQIKKKDMEARNGHQNNERKLFHGACHTTIDKINELGFNRSYAGKNAALYGDGTYFAVNAKYSASDKYSKPDPQGQKYMYLCRVLTGDFITGTLGMKVPPTKSTTSINLYDSVTDSVSPPSMFIIFHDSQAYPEYLITFK
ncbi:protein mono-ADP-ribosyltransferase PARP14-like [Oncorhynchus nerka]|uniref:protein mono-ADP-ribosyltransferase PARP14-like n=1 Tax=Oncorhynchus nerka TaxID=8023 RepID=UPI0031B81CA3